MNYTLHQLRVFLKVVEYKSITKASEDLFLTQPAVSLQLKKLQDQFDIPLTELIGRQLYITDFGREIAAAAEQILQTVESIDYKTKAYKGQLAGKLKIGVVSTGKYVMPYFLSNFMQLHRGIDLVMDVTNKAQVVSGLSQNEVDFALVSVLPEQLQLESVELMQNKLYLVGGSCLPKRGRTSLQKLFQQYPLLYRESGSATRGAMESFLQQRELSSYKMMELTSNEALKQALIAGLGYSVMPLIGIKNALKNGDLEIIPVKGLPIITKWRLVWLRQKKRSPIAQAFLDYIQQHKDNIIKQHFGWYEEYN